MLALEDKRWDLSIAETFTNWGSDLLNKSKENQLKETKKKKQVKKTTSLSQATRDRKRTRLSISVILRKKTKEFHTPGGKKRKKNKKNLRPIVERARGDRKRKKYNRRQ